MKIKKLVKLAPMMLLTFLLGLSGCSGSTSADARVNDHPNEADEELHVLTIGSIRFIKNPDDRNCRQRRNHVPGWQCHRLCFKRT